MKREGSGVDLVALVLALTLALGVLLITTVSIVNVTTHQVPTQSLGENTTQVLTSVLGGIVGVLGGYVGFKTRPHSSPAEQADEGGQGQPAVGIGTDDEGEVA